MVFVILKIFKYPKPTSVTKIKCPPYINLNQRWQVFIFKQVKVKLYKSSFIISTLKVLSFIGTTIETYLKNWHLFKIGLELELKMLPYFKQVQIL
jgi:hypothetical protein